jgi:polyisoprenoid-binding protein YceI
MIRLLTLAVCMTLAFTARAEVWQAGAGSTLKFQAVQQRASFEGVFKTFTAQIDFDPADPAAGRIEANIDLGSVDTDYADRDEYLRDTEWFNIMKWPAATFVASDISVTDSGFLARGELSLRGVSQPVEFRFTVGSTPAGARLQGSAKLLRLEFDVGTGDWADTEWVANEVGVTVDLQLVPADST